MKSLKYLLIIAVITLIVSLSGVNAYFYKDVLTITNLSVPAHNGHSISKSKKIDTVDTGTYHYLKEINTTDELDAKLAKNSSIFGPWVIVKNGKITQLVDDLSNPTLLLTGGTFNIYFDSRWYYTKATTLKKAKWYLENNLS